MQNIEKYFIYKPLGNEYTKQYRFEIPCLVVSFVVTKFPRELLLVHKYYKEYAQLRTPGHLTHEYAKWSNHELIHHAQLSIRMNNLIPKHKTHWTSLAFLALVNLTTTETITFFQVPFYNSYPFYHSYPFYNS